MAAETKTADDSEAPLTKVTELLENIARPLLKYITIAIPFIITYSQKAYVAYKKMAVDQVQLIIGFILCFFGGLYPTLFAAIEAARHGGMGTLKQALGDLADEAIVIIEANAKDDQKDEDNSGKADVDEMTAKELLLRKTHLVLTKMNPQKVDDALGSLYKVWLSIVATLTIQFARTITLALTICDVLDKASDHFVKPMVTTATPKEYRKWVPIVLGWITKSISMSIAWYIQTIISAFTSAIQGGLIISQTLLKMCIEKGINPGGLIPKNNEATYIDEYACYFFAACGFYFQFKIGFNVPFPFNIFLWPLEMAEYYIRWAVTTKS